MGTFAAKAFEVKPMMKIVYTALLLLTAGSAAAQSCGSDIWLQNYLKEHPEAVEQIKALDEGARQYKPSGVRAKFIIPVVFHVIHTGGPENISKEQILDQMRVLNQDFNLTNPNKSKIRTPFKTLAAVADIEFRLARIDPNGNCTDGINRVYSPLGVDVNQNTEDVKFLSGARWDYRRYLNIWVVTSIDNGGGQGTILGYAVFPFATSASRDGIVIRHDRVGTIGTAIPSDSGRTLTHEVGHWLGLYHTFQDGCFGNNDQCDDTPPVASTFTNANCPANGNSCTNDVPDLPDQWENFMDYSEGSCMAMFTPDQRDRIWYFLGISSGGRALNVSNTNITTNTGVVPQTAVAPVANFSASRLVVCTGEPVRFFDESCKGLVSARSWSFPGASTPSSTLESPTVIYQTPGTYSVTLVVQNSRGSNQASKTNYITVKPATASLKSPLIEGFESSFPAPGWTSYTVNSKGWNTTASAFHYGAQSLVLPITSSFTAGLRYAFETPQFDISPIKGQSPKLSFMVGHARRDANTNEVLRIYISTNCGASWTQILERSGAGLASVTSLTPGFAPTSQADWKRINLSLTPYENATNMAFKFEVESAAGNPVYIDDINISQYFTSVEAITGTPILAAEVFPNPSQEDAALRISLREPCSGNLRILDATGRILHTAASNMLPAGTHTIPLNLKQQALKAGVYFIQFEGSGFNMVKPFSYTP
jgi:PKD repeat protein